MDLHNSGIRVTLTNNEVTSTRLIIYASVFTISFLYFRFFFHQPEFTSNYENNPDHLVPFPTKLVIIIMITALSFFLSVAEILVILNVKLFRAKVEYDHENLYIMRKRQESIISLTCINAIRGINNFNRGSKGKFPSI